MKSTGNKILDDNLISEQSTKNKHNKLTEHELDELRDHVDLVSFNIEKIYRKVRSQFKKDFNQARSANVRKTYFSYKNEK